MHRHQEEEQQRHSSEEYMHYAPVAGVYTHHPPSLTPYYEDLQSYPTGIVHDHHLMGHDHLHPHIHSQQQQLEYSQSLNHHHPMRYLGEGGLSPNLIKFESPSLLHTTPPLRPLE
jgi:hypothetical protein